MRQKIYRFGNISFATVDLFLWGLLGGQTGSGIEFLKQAKAAGGTVNDPVGTAPDRYIYYPGTMVKAFKEKYKMKERRDPPIASR
jgi:hypothetical protein